jgi:SRSO17 transposase
VTGVFVLDDIGFIKKGRRSAGSSASTPTPPGIPAECCGGGGFATKPELGVAMLNRAYQAGALISASWVTADEAYGQNPAFRDWLTGREIPFVLGTRNDDLLTSPDGHRRPAKALATIAGVDENGQAGVGWERRRRRHPLPT